MLLDKPFDFEKSWQQIPFVLRWYLSCDLSERIEHDVGLLLLCLWRLSTIYLRRKVPAERQSPGSVSVRNAEDDLMTYIFSFLLLCLLLRS